MSAQQDMVLKRLTGDIASGHYPEGSWLPTAAEIARKHKCSPHAVSRAFRQLSERGIVRSTRRKGTRVLCRPAAGRVMFMSSWDPHTNLLLQDEINRALVHAHVEVNFLPYLFHDGAGFEHLRQLASKDAHDIVLVTLTQERVPDEIRPEWEKFAVKFRYRVGFQFEDTRHLPDSVTFLPDPAVAARLVAQHLLSLGHRCIGVVAGGNEMDGSASARHTSIITEMLALVGAKCVAYHYEEHALEGVAVFARRHGCTAWWAINDHQALDHLIQFQRAGLQVPGDISVLGANDTPWALNSALPLTTLSLDPPRIAAAMVAAVEALIAGDEPPTGSQKMIPPILVPRASTARCNRP